MKENKKVLIPIIIGTALLIALIIGATYAYFQASNTASGTTNLDATTEAIGNVVVTNPTENLYLKLSAYEMQESKKGTSYYATTQNSSSSSVYASEKEEFVLARYSITGGTEETTYNCTFNLNIQSPTSVGLNDMIVELNLLNGTTMNHFGTGDFDIMALSGVRKVSFSTKGNGQGDLIKAAIRINNLQNSQDHLIGKTLSTSISVSNLECEVAEPEEESICTLASDSTVEAGLEGAKYICKVDPNKPEYTFYLLDNNEDGTSDLIMDQNINSDGTPAGSTKIVNNGNNIYNQVEWLTIDDYKTNRGPNTEQFTDEGACQYGGACSMNELGPITAMTYLYNATKDWTNIEPVNYTYNDKEIQGTTQANTSYTSFISANGVAIITSLSGTGVTIGTSDRPLRARMPIYSSDTTKTEVASSNENNNYLYDYLDFSDYWFGSGTRPANNVSGMFGYWTLSSAANDSGSAITVYYNGTVDYGNRVAFDHEYGVRPVITVKL